MYLINFSVCTSLGRGYLCSGHRILTVLTTWNLYHDNTYGPILFWMVSPSTRMYCTRIACMAKDYFLLQGNNLYSETIPMHGSHALMWSSIKKNITAYIWNSFQNRIYRQKRLDCHNAEFWKRAYIMTHVPYCAMAAPPITWRYLFSITTWPRQDLKLLLTF